VDNRRKLGFKIYTLRQKSGLTQTELAEKAQISVKYLQNLEGRNPKNPSFDVLVRIAKALNTELWKLLKF